MRVLALSVLTALTAPVCLAVPFGSSSDCVEENIAAHIFMSRQLISNIEDAPFSDPKVLELFYGMELTQCHALALLREKGISRSIEAEIEQKRQQNDRDIGRTLSAFSFWGDREIVFEHASSCVPDSTRSACLSKVLAQ